eukprot:4912641-Pleurochrysis_carterae.AAC.1
MAYPATSPRPTFSDMQRPIKLVRAGGLQASWTSFLAAARAAPPRSAPPRVDTTARPASRCAPLSRLVSPVNAGHFSKAWSSLDSAPLISPCPRTCAL